MKSFKPVFFSVLALLFSAILLFIFAETLLRIKGYSCKRYTYDKLTVIFEPDSLLGWKSKPGIYEFKYSQLANPVKVTIWHDGSRATQVIPVKKDKKVIVLGCSNTFGWCLPDEETFVWKLQQEFPLWEFRNYGTGGYGTYQSLLLLERIFAETPPPEVVWYGFCDFHEDRNVVSEPWLKLITERSIGGDIRVPYCTLGNKGSILRQAPQPYAKWPLRNSFSTIAFFEEQFMKIKTGKREQQKRYITERLILEMNNLCKAKKSKFVVLILGCEENTKLSYADFFLKNKISFIDCVFSGQYNPELAVPGDGHPSGLMNSHWASCIKKTAGLVGAD